MVEEKERLEITKKQFQEVIEDLELTIQALNRRQMMDPDALYALIKQYENKLRIVKESLNKPYFARIDFDDAMQKVKDVCYIGKVGVSDVDKNIITVDWRAPIASLYYDSNIGPASYQAPEGIIQGELTLKRQYDIEHGKLISYNDVDTVSNDEILRPYLGVNADNRLKNIVSSIQQEQNTIIRKDLFHNLVIQGVAGSGKTTVALHRIAYLAYNYRDKIKSNQYLVIGPNKFFINYISSVLPDLDVTDVPQWTYEEFVKDFLNEEFVIEDYGRMGKEINLNKFKLSMEYKKCIDSYVDYLDEQEVLPNKDFDVKGFKILPKEVIQQIYREIENTYYPNLEAKIERLVLLLSSYLKDQQEKVLSSFMAQYNMMVDQVETQKEKSTLLKNYETLKKELTGSGCSASLRKYLNFKNKKITTLYSDFLKNIDSYVDKEIANEIKKYQSKKRNTYVIEDLAGLLYLGYKVKESKEFKKYRHTVIDEAQDYGEFNFYALKQVLSASSFSVFGDLAQSIYDYRSINCWEDAINQGFDGDCSLEYLRKSYRTTIEIMNSANEVLRQIGLATAEPVIRHGEDVKFIKIDKDYYSQLLNHVQQMEKKKYDSIALISRDEEEAHKIKEELKKLGKEIEEITFENQAYHGGICSVSSALAKGLEFDAVIVTDASEQKYQSSDTTDMKNLYVSMTRPLHELEIFYQDILTQPLQKCLKK